jgi:protein SCO1/2
MRRALLPIFAVLCLAAAFSMHRRAPAPAPTLPQLGTLPPFSLTDEHGDAFPRDKLHGKIAVFDFVFTNCATACPLLTQEMARLQDEVVKHGLDQRVRLLSVSVDPERDTLDKLRAYAQRAGADPRVWHFLRGDEASLRKVVVDGLLQVMDKQADKAALDGFTILHGTRFVLVDDKARIRGFYDANDAADRARLRHDLFGLAKGGIRLAADPATGQE